MPKETLQAEVQTALADRYSLERELPRGGMSRVFVAMESALHRRVVVKVLSPELAATLSAERFKREIALAARLQHPHIVPLLAAGQAGPHLYYTMPFVDGESLREKMDRERPMALADIVRILQEVAGALAYAHDEGIVHRDIKPENVMFFHGQAVVLDFGIGKALLSASTAETETQRITLAGVSLGTPTYIAPEQAAADPALDHRADLYALGVVAYEMLTGHPPFTGRSAQAVLEGHARRTPDPIAARRPDVPPQVAAIVMQCLAKPPSARPMSGRDVVQALEPGRQTPSDASSSVGGLLSRAPHWLPWALTAASLALALLFAGLLLSR